MIQERKLMVMGEEGRMRRGRSKIKWKDTIEKIAQNRGQIMAEMKIKYRDQKNR